MSSESTRRRRWRTALPHLALLALAFACALAAGCGKKGDPMPAPRTIPQTISDLAVRQRGLEVVLEMAYPKTTVAGLPLPGLDELVVFELERPAPMPTPVPTPPTPPDRREFAAAAKPLLRIGGGELASAISGDRVTVRFRLPEPLPAPAPIRFFGVRTHAAGGETSDLSNLVALVPREVPAAPTGFAFTPQKSGIELSWTAPAQTVAGFNVYRRQADRTGYGAPIATRDGTANSAVDGAALYGQRYIYAVTAIAGREPLVESALSAEREVAYEDRFAPVPPRGLTALPSPGEVRLVWEPVAEPDVAGYVVERADPGSDFHRVTERPTSELELTDRGLGSGFTFRYRVAAVDRAGNLGEPSTAVEARVP